MRGCYTSRHATSPEVLGCRFRICSCLCDICCATADLGRSAGNPLPMPPDRAADTYGIYSQLLPGDEIEWGSTQRSFWLIQVTTKAEPLESSCATGGAMNPHQAIQAPEERRTDLAEVFADFDTHCHDRYRIDASRLHLKFPVRLLDEEARTLFIRRVEGYMPPRTTSCRHRQRRMSSKALRVCTVSLLCTLTARILWQSRKSGCSAEVFAGIGVGLFWSAKTGSGKPCPG